jgi:hypothetical protein
MRIRRARRVVRAPGPVSDESDLPLGNWRRRLRDRDSTPAATGCWQQGARLGSGHLAGGGRPVGCVVVIRSDAPPLAQDLRGEGIPGQGFVRKIESPNGRVAWLWWSDSDTTGGRRREHRPARLGRTAPATQRRPARLGRTAPGTQRSTSGAYRPRHPASASTSGAYRPRHAFHSEFICARGLGAAAVQRTQHHRRGHTADPASDSATAREGLGASRGRPREWDLKDQSVMRPIQCLT